MLKRISVKNLAIIEDIEVELYPALNVLTGETGAGKSIIVGAIGLLMGDRASSEMIRAGSDSARVEAMFDISKLPVVKQNLAEWEMDEGAELIVSRVIAKSGSNRVYLNGAMATLTMLRSIGESLVNIYGQHESQGLLRPDSHLEILDEFGGLEKQREAVEDQFDLCKQKQADLKELLDRQAARAAREDYLKFRIEQIEKVGLKPGELEDLEASRKKLKGADQLAAAAGEIFAVCYDNSGSIVEQMQALVRQTEKARQFDPAFADSAQALIEQITIASEEAGTLCRSYLSTLDHDPAALETIDDRLHQLRGLLKKYGPTEGDAIESLREAKEELAQLGSIGDQVDQAQKELDQALCDLGDKAKDLEKKRYEAAKRMSAQIEKELRDLDIAHAKFSAKIEPLDAGGLDIGKGVLVDRTGCNKIEFMLSANPGEPERPLAKTASGGELSRILLAIKNALAKNFYVPSLVFDEVDAGISGRQAQAVGAKLSSVAKHHQVLCITHLPQIAAKANKHFHVSKSIKKGRTVTSINLLDKENRVDELARLISGDNITQASKTAAIEMMK